jgi:hypothetical protein
VEDWRGHGLESTTLDRRTTDASGAVEGETVQS